MCGRYSLALRPSQVRRFLENENLPVNPAPDEDQEDPHTPRQTYNFAPGYYGTVYRADVPGYGAGPRPQDKNSTGSNEDSSSKDVDMGYKLQSMKWGLIPFWTKRSPDYGSMLKTINCRADSLALPSGLWTTMKARKRCIVVCQGFYEWKTKNGHKTPYYIKRADGKLMCFAGLWDCVRYENSEEDLWTYTIVTTDSNKQLSWLHDRMPVILESEKIRTWLNPRAWEWDNELQGLCRPYEGELEFYAVSQEVGKVGNNSKNFIVPVDSKENKNNIANFFAKGKKEDSQTGADGTKREDVETDVKTEGDDRVTVNVERSEDNAPMPLPKEEVRGVKREHSTEKDVEDTNKARRLLSGDIKIKTEESPAKASSPIKQKVPASSKKTRSATSNGTLSPSKTDPKAKGTHKITSFFGKG